MKHKLFKSINIIKTLLEIMRDNIVESKSFPFIIDHLRISDISDLSLSEILTLHLLLNYKDPVVRYTLYLDVQNYLSNEESYVKPKKNPKLEGFEGRFLQFLLEEKKFSTSSFYYSLSKLEKKGLLNFVRDKKSNVSKVKANKVTEFVINFIFQSISSMITDDFSFINEIAQEINDMLGNRTYEFGLIVWGKKYLEINLINYFKENINQLYFLAEEDVFHNLQKLNIESINPTKVLNKMIREPNDIFDIAIIPNYSKIFQIYDIDRLKMMSEVNRVLKNGSKLIVSARTSLPKTNNYYANRLLAIYRKITETKGRFFTKEEIKSDFIQARFSNIEIHEYQGILLAIGTK